MSEDNQERKPKWDRPEIEDFDDESSDWREPDGQKGWGHQHGGCRPIFGGCRPMFGGCWPVGMCRPRFLCYPNTWGCQPRMCFPRPGFNPFCRPNGFNYGYGCHPRG